MWNVSFDPNIFQVTKNTFEEMALRLFSFQAEHNPLYREYLRIIGADPSRVDRISAIPFLPIRFFKTHRVATTPFETGLFFESSGTTGSINSRHWVKYPALYERSFLEGFRLFYGPPEDWCILGLLPSYLERSHSSLVYMVSELVKRSRHPASGFYLNEHEKLAEQLMQLDTNRQPTLLIGVTFGLLDFADRFDLSLTHTTVMETGGMKGRREEWTREEIHTYLRARWGVADIHSEYGMTELLSQAYSTGSGVFQSVPWMRVFVREEDDPLVIHPSGKGALNIIDLANVYSCAFIGTEDVGTLQEDGRFSVLGRLDNSDIRGCSLMLTL
jgi:hypothetical protein